MKTKRNLPSPHSHSIDRRQFLRVGASATFAATSSLALLHSGVHASPSSQLRLAFIGVGGRGRANLETMAKDPDVTVAAICDIDSHALDATAKLHPNAQQFVDFRKLYENDDFDAVVVSTAEHTHAFATMPALRRGLPVYCEKPLTHNIAESRAIAQAAEAACVATQMGTQIHAGDNYHRVVELIQTGAIGAVTEAHVWVGRAWGLQSKAEAEANQDLVYVTERPKESMTPPEHLDWDLWLGPAPERPYHDVYLPGPKWYRWWDFGSGTMSDLGSHWNDLAFWALGLNAPLRVEAFGDDAHPEIAPASMSAVYEYGPRVVETPGAETSVSMPACKVHWYQGSHRPQRWIDKAIPQWNSGVLFVGDSGMLLSDYRKHILLPEDQFAEFEYPQPFVPDSPGQHEEWLQACREGTPTASPFSYAGPLTEANHLGNVAYRAGTAIEWDAAAMRVTNNENANAFCSRVPRAGWKLDG